VIRFYLDEDAGDRGLLSALGDRGVDVLSAAEAGNLRWPDPRQLEYATREGRTICTYNQGDFSALHSLYVSEARTHSGIVIMRQAYASFGARAGALERLSAASSPESMSNALVYLSDWIVR
jgi:hypothetical protein